MKDSLFFRTAYIFSLVAIFIGNVKIPFTMPLSMLVSLVYLVRVFKVQVTMPFVLLLGVLIPGVTNLIIAGYSDIGRDYVIYMPVLYGLYVLLFVGGFSYRRELEYALIIGVTVLCLWIYFAYINVLGGAEGYYQLKLYAETPLGRSNYLAVFIGFCLMLSTYRYGWSFFVLAPAFILTMSRTGILLLTIFMLLRFITVRRNIPAVLVGASLLMTLLISYWGQVYYYLDYVLEGALSTDSINIRLRSWWATLEIVQINPLFGVPRSLYKDALEVALPGHNIWDPHNSVLHLLVSYGLIGLGFYVAYVIIIFREFYNASLTSKFWKGVCWGYSLLLCWSLFEAVLLTPAIELFQAYLFIMARKYRRSLREKNANIESNILLNN